MLVAQDAAAGAGPATAQSLVTRLNKIRVTIDNAGRIIFANRLGGFMSRTSGPRKTANLSKSTNRQLNMYALAAGAAGVSMLALARPAEAKIVYTHANIHIKIDNGVTELDINHDGINDFKFTNYAAECGAPRAGTIDCIATLKVAPARPSNRVVDIKSNIGYCAAALPNGVKVGPGGPFRLHPSGLTMAYENTGAGANYCPWRPVKLAYLGVKFFVSGKVHFGWVRIKRLSGSGFPATITGYAYETIVGKSIKAGRRGRMRNRLPAETTGDKGRRVEAPSAIQLLGGHRWRCTCSQPDL
jgi:hypothetical protein